MPDSVIYPLAELTAAELQASRWRPILPELYALEQTIENSPGHDHQNVLTHTIGVMAGLEKVIQAEFLSPREQQTLTTYLQQKVANHSHLELLRLAVVSHDLLKGKTLLSNAQGITNCPAHEILAVAKVPEFQARFGLDWREVTWVQEIVRHHGFPHSLLEVCLAKPAIETHLFAEFTQAVGGTTLEVILLVYADILGGDSAKSDPVGTMAREELCQTWLQRLVVAI